MSHFIEKLFGLQKTVIYLRARTIFMHRHKHAHTHTPHKP
jgi:hypothetical protein